MQSSCRIEEDMVAATLDLSTTDLAIALEPFGYGRDKTTGQRSTTLRQLPEILAKFQDSRETLYLSNDALKQIMDFAASNPEQLVGDDILNDLLQTAKQVNAKPSPAHPDSEQPSQNSRSPSPEQRIRTAESPSSSTGARSGIYYGSNSPSPAPSISAEQQDQLAELSQPDNSFDSTQEQTITQQSSSNSPLSPPKPPRKPPAPERHRSVPIGFGDTFLKRPRPPSRRSKVSSVDLHSHHSTPSRFAHHRPISATLRSQSSPNTEEGDQDDSSDHNSNQTPQGLGTPFSTRHPQSQSFSETSLTPNNLSSVIFSNRQRGLYDSSDDNPEAGALPDPAEDGESDPTDIIRRIRPDQSSRPSSKVFTRLYESGVGLDGYPTPQAELQPMIAEDLARSCENLRTKNKELVNQIVALEKMHDDELGRLTDELEELKQELSSCKKSEKDLANFSATLSYQLTNSDDQMSRLNSSKSLLEENYHKIKIKWEEAVAESEKLRTQLNLKEEELRCTNRSIQSHASEVKKWELDRQMREEHIKNLNMELQELQTTREILEEQKQANLDLKATIDRLKYELDEQRTRNAGSSVADSRPTSIAGSLSQNLGEEFKKAISTGDYGPQEDSGSDTSGDETAEINRIIKDAGAGEPSPEIDGDAIFQEIRIRRYKRSKTLVRGESSGAGEGEQGSTFIDEEEIELQDAATDTADLTAFKTADTQTDPVPEPPPVYRPKMEDLQVQTDAVSESGPLQEEEETQGEAGALLELVAGIDPQVLKLAIEHIKREMNEPARSGPSTTEEAGDSEEDDGASSSTAACRPTTSVPNEREKKTGDAEKEGPGYWSRWGRSAAVRLDGLFSTLGLLSPRAAEDAEGEGPEWEGGVRRRVRLCSSIVLVLATGYVLGSLIMRGPATTFSCPSGPPALLSPSDSSSCIMETLKRASTEHLAYSLALSSAPPPPSPPAFNSSSASPINHSVFRVQPASLAQLIDFNAVAAGKEGFIVSLRTHIDLLLRWKNFGTSMLWNTVSRYQTSPT
ncbi:hypothetical protein PtB15_9B374 [Puccinia triticina]|nr:hypothetical protein PtB15_9B374 [Puccinia triticina]